MSEKLHTQAFIHIVTSGENKIMVTRERINEILEKLRENNPEINFFDLREEIALDLNDVNGDLDLETDKDKDKDPESDKKNIDDILCEFAAAIQNNTTIETFATFSESIMASPSFFPWSAIGTKAIGTALKNHPTLKNLFLDIEKNSDIEFLEALTGTANIQSFKLNNLTDDLFVISHYLAKNKSITDFYFNNFDDNDTDYDDDQLISFFAALANKQLQQISIDMQTGDGGFKFLANVLEDMHGLEHITIKCGMTSDSLNAIEKILMQNPNVQTLNLECNSLFNPDNVEGVVRIIENNKKLKSLDIGRLANTSDCIKLLQTILSDPNKCRLQYFGYFNLEYSTNPRLKENINPTLKEILSANRHLLSIDDGLSLCNKDLVAACKQKKKRIAQADFVSSAVELAKIYYSLSPLNSDNNNNANNNNNRGTSIRDLPLVIVLIIMQEVGKATLGKMNPKYIYQCSALIFANLATRRQLINEGEYVAKTEVTFDANYELGTGIGKWWSKTTRDEAQLKIFGHIGENTKQKDEELPEGLKNAKRKADEEEFPLVQPNLKISRN